MAETSPPADPQESPLASNVVYGAASFALMALAKLVTGWAVIFWYGPAFHSNLVWLLSAAWVGMLASDLGLAGKAGIREIARRRAAESDRLGEAVSELITIPLVVATVLAAAMILLAGPLAAVKGVEDLWAVRLAGTWILLQAGIRVCRAVSIGFERMGNLLFMDPVTEVGKMLCVLACAALKLPAEWIFLGWTAALLGALIVALLRTRVLARELHVRILPRLTSPGRSARTVAGALPYYVPQLGVLCLPFVVQLVVGVWHPTGAAVSVFNICFALAMISRILATPISAALLPRVAHADASCDSTDGTTVVLVKIARLLALATTLGFALYAAGGAQLLRIYGKGEYVDALPALLLLAFAVGVDNYSLQLDQVLMATRHVKPVARGELVRYLTLGVVLCAAVPTWPVLGAAAGVCAAAVANATFKILVARTRFPTIGGVPFVQGVMVFAIVACVRALPYGVWLSLPAWLLAVLLFQLLQPKELSAWARALPAAFGPKRSTTPPRA